MEHSSPLLQLKSEKVNWPPCDVHLELYRPLHLKQLGKYNVWTKEIKLKNVSPTLRDLIHPAASPLLLPNSPLKCAHWRRLWRYKDK